MTDVSLTIALPLLGAFLRPLLSGGVLDWIGRLLGPVLLALVAVILFAHWSTYTTPQAIALGGFAPPLGIALYIDGIALLFALAVPLTTLVLWPGDDGDAGMRRQALTLLLAASLIGLALSGDLFNLYVFYELAAVASYGLAAGSGSAPGYIAAFRYLLLSALGSVIGLIGVALVYFATGTLNLADLALQGEALSGPQGLAAFAMLLIGFGVKAELFPVNGWVAEVYATAGHRVAALLAGLASKLAVLAVVRILVLVFPDPAARDLLLLLGVIGVLTGELAAWQARDMSRMLAWSSIGQLGVVFIAFSLPGEAGLLAGIAVALHHLVVKTALFLLAGRWGGSIAALGGAAAASPLGAALFMLFALSLLGMPPLPGFWSKFLVLGGLADAATPLHYLAMAVIMLGTVIEGGYLLRVATTLYRAPDQSSPVLPPRGADLFASALFGVVLIAAAVMIEPLWQSLSGMADSGASVAVYADTVLNTSGIAR